MYSILVKLPDNPATEVMFDDLETARRKLEQYKERGATKYVLLVHADGISYELESMG